MVKLNKIYTRTGDDGTSGLVDGSRRPKSDLRFEAFGDVDEANCAIGIARLHVTPAIDAVLLRIQNDLFDLGADLATPYGEEELPYALRIVDTQVAWLEEQIDAFNEAIPPIKSFVLPGGSKAASYLHLARTITRRAERVAYAVAQSEKITDAALRYLNRLSDLLFVLARAANENGAADVLWEPGKNR